MADELFDELLGSVAAGDTSLAKPEAVDPIFNAIAEEAGAAERVRNEGSIQEALKAKPEVYADHKALAETFGVNLDFVQRNADKLKPISGAMEMRSFLQSQPELSGWYTQGDNAHAIKFDELRYMSGLRWLWHSGAQAAGDRLKDFDLAALREKQLFRIASDDEIGRANLISASREPRTYGADSWFEGAWIGTAQFIPTTLAALVGGFDEAVVGAGAGAGAAAIAGQVGPQVALPEEIITVPTGAAIGFGVGSLVGQAKENFKFEAGLAYDEFLSMKDETGAPLDDDVARAAAFISGSAAALLETVAFRKLASTVPGLDAVAGTLGRDTIRSALMRPTVRTALKNFAVNSISTAAVEVSTEIMQEAITIFAGEAAKAYDGDFQMLDAEDIGERIGDVFEQTLQTMTIMGPLLAGSRLGHDVSRARASARDQAMIGALMTHAEGNELNARLPEKSKEAIRTLTENGPVQWVYVDPNAIQTYFQTAEEASKFAASAGITEEYNEAIRLGRDVEIPIENYYVNIAGTEIGAALKGFTKISPDAMYADEAEAFNDAWAEAQASLRADYEAAEVQDKQALEGEERVFEDVKNKAMDAGIVPDQATQYGKLYAAFFRVMAERTGQDAGELYAHYGVDIKRALQPHERQGRAVDNLDLALELIRRNRVDPMRKAIEKASGPSLLQAIAARGGIVDTGGDLKSIGADKIKGIVRQAETGQADILAGEAPADLGDFNMYGADDTLRQMWEEGYFPEFTDRPEVSALFDAIAEEIAGRKRFSVSKSKADDPAVQQARGLVDFADMLDQAGIDPSTMDNDAIRAAIDELVNADPETAALFQPAWHGSPHIFDAFTLDAIGTGEGAQAYGWGLYFASKREVSEWYRDKLSRGATIMVMDDFDARELALTNVSGDANNLLVEFAGNLDMELPEGADARLQRYMDDRGNAIVQSAIRRAMTILGRDVNDGQKTAEWSLDYQLKEQEANFKSAKEDRTKGEAAINIAVLRAIQKETINVQRGGRLYKVEVPEDSELLDWNKPLSEQAPEIKAKLATLGFAEKKPPKIADPEVGLILRQAMKQADGDPLDARDVIDNRQDLFDHARRLMKRAGVDPDSDEAPSPGHWIAEQARDHIQAILDNRKLTGEGIYQELSRRMGEQSGKTNLGWTSTDPVYKDDKAASEALRAAGIPGHRYEGHESQSTNYVIYDDSRVAIQEFFQADQEFASLRAQKALADELYQALKPDGGKDKEAVNRAFAAMVDTGKAKQAVVDALADTDDGIELANKDGSMHAAVTKSQQPGGGWRVTYFNKSGFIGHTELDTKRQALEQALGEGYITEDAGALRRATKERTFFQRAEEREASGEAGAKRGSIQLAPGRTIINLFEAADLSTFLHESGHFFLEVFRDIAMSQPVEIMGPQGQIVSDWQTVREYLGIGDDGTIPVEAHEKFARTFEAYLFEGKAPSAEVAGIFSRFRSWLVFVYRNIRNLNAPINDKIRRVMDRMVATDEEIKAAMTGPEFHPAFTDQQTAGMTDAQWKDYTETAGRAVERARRDMDQRMLSEIARETTKEWRDAKSTIRKEVTASMTDAPIYRAIAYLRGKLPDAVPGMQLHLDKQAIVDMLGEGALFKLPRGVPPIYRAKGGVHPDVIAELFGFKSGHDLLQQLMATPSLGRAISDEVGARMKARYGDLMADAVARARAAEEAIANDATGELLAAELAVLVRKGLVTTKATKEGAKQAAKNLVRSKPIRQAIRVKLYMNAAQKAAAEAEAAIRKEDWKAAISAKQKQMLNHYMAVESHQVEKDTTAAVTYLNRFTGRKKPKGVRLDELDQIDALLERFDFRKSVTMTDAARRAKLSEWIAAQEAAGELPAIPEFLAPTEAFRTDGDKAREARARADAFRKPYREMTVDDLMAVRDAVKSIEHIGRRWAAVEGDIEGREHRAKVAELTISAEQAGTDAIKQKGQNPSTFDEFLSFTRSADGALMKIEQFLSFLDNGDINGPFRRLIWQPIADAEAKANDLQVEYSGKILEIIGKLDPRRLSETLTIPGINRTMKRADVIAVALNTGNASSLDKMMRGEGWDYNPAILDRVLAQLNADEAKAVQEIWDTIDSLWPEIERVQRKLSGNVPPKIEARPVEIAGQKLRGGYFPMIYDPARNHQVELRQMAAADKMFENSYMRPETWHGFAKERQQAYAAPVDFNLENVAKHIINVIHDTTHREAILQANRLLTDASVRNAIVEKFGRERYNQLVPWLQSIANDRRQADGLDTINRILRGVRSRASIMGMGLRYSTLVTQLLGYSASLEIIKPKHLAGAMRDFFGADGGMAIGIGAAIGGVASGGFGIVGGASAGGALYAATRAYAGGTSSMDAMSQEVFKLSAEMRHRKNQLDRDIRDNIRKFQGKSDWQAAAVRFGFAGIGYMDQAITVPTWMAAYRQHLADHPTDQAGAIAFADQTMRLSQGAGGAKDLAAVMRKNEGVRLLTMFYSYFSAYYARQRKWGRDFKRKVSTGEGSYQQLLARQVFLTIIPAVMADLILGKGPDEEDEGYAEWAAKKIAMYPFAAVPLIKDGISAIGSGFGYSISPAGRTIDEGLVQPLQMVGKILEGEAELRPVVKQTIETTGYVMGLPLGQPATSVDNIWKAIEDDDFQLRDLVLPRPKN